jgi:hypothetical protein
MNFSLLPVWVKPVGFVLLAVALVGGGYWRGHHVASLACERDAEKVQNELLAAKLEAIDKQIALQAEGQEKLTAALAKVPGKETIREIVKNNPSGCVLPQPVVDGLRRQTDEARRAYPGP